MTSIPLGEEQGAWDREYCSRGRIYSKAPQGLPSLASGSIVLEAGCGDGKTLTAMVSRAWEILAIDFSIEAIRLCQKNPFLPEVVCIQADMRTLPFKEESFDGVFLSHSIGHSLESARLYIAREAARVLKSGGRLFFRAFSSGDFRAGTGTMIESNTWIRGYGIQTHYFTEPEVISLFSHLHQVELKETCWSMMVRGRTLKRAEIVAEFMKT
ncbi:MAG: class I SAM-dependent methyltransferase [Methanoregulaceae archaeon]|nr:class I SAM-dependent methyltransferase [Methanoregulaceae archaeon]